MKFIRSARVGGFLSLALVTAAAAQTPDDLALMKKVTAAAAAAPASRMDLKALQAQLKAATTPHHLHSVAHFVYDPSIKITMSAN